MKIGIDTRSALKKNRTGIGNYTVGLVGTLAGIDTESEYYLYGHIRPFELKRRSLRLPGKNFRRRTDRISFDPSGTMKDMEVFHTSSFDIPAYKYRLFTTVHDLIPMFFTEGYSEEYLKGFENTMKRVLRESHTIITDSVNTKNDIEQNFPGCARHIEVVYPGVVPLGGTGNNVSREVLIKKYGLKDGFVLYSGGMDPRKNLFRLLEAFRILKESHNVSHKLVLTGKKGKNAVRIEDKAHEYGVAPDVIFTGYISDMELASLYLNADVFAYPSLYEGFGFPILEAFMSGCPVVTASTSSCAEIAGDGALTVDPLDVSALAEALYKVLSDRELSIDLRSRGLKRAGNFSWENSALRILELFRRKPA